MHIPGDGECCVKPLPHSYDITLTADASMSCTASGGALPDLAMAPPLEYDGPGNAWSPEHTLLAAAGACFVFTFRSIARMARLNYERIDLQTSGIVAKQSGVTRFTEIILRPRITVSAGIDRDRVLDAIKKAEVHCLIANSLTTPVRIEPEIDALAPIDDPGVAAIAADA